MTRIMQLWFVRCQRDDPVLDTSWQSSAHPHIYHVCSTCKTKVHEENPFGQHHEVRRAVAEYQYVKDLNTLLDHMFDTPTQYLEAPKS